MIRQILTEFGLFLIPFALYAGYLMIKRVDVFDRASWPLDRLVWLTVAAVAIMIAGFILLAQFSGAPPGGTYEPAHMENGRFVPGRTR
ncbi:MAG: hypothetical protein KJZ73_07090 [Pseudorhodoplanes sp.]|nr:hypothetical protein [Pseudorhodoplanes sp.]MBW7949149.1 hypothetical protein [Pseudorhodoplanes sp.]MCL4710999.1 hypothetical protein [Pseudorhodoplanes sp.]MCQ3943191.1 hypothetical protein [Alphaproteobacteria bacterium]GIK80137.1 MAG: hypothetical protein BroJett024_12420 [Alphaproteobacteria bacterium]